MSSTSPWYRDTADAAAIPPEVAERALEWLVELQAPSPPPALRDAWARWRAAHPDHERAWQRIEAVNGRLEPLASPLHAAIAQAALLPPRSATRRRAVKHLAVLVFAGGAAWSIDAYTPWRAWTSDYRTGVGERRALVLPDGTSVTLNTDSAIDVRFSAAERRIRLVDGEVYIATAADTAAPPRPFLVETAQGTAEALGTAYSVRQRDGDTQLDVFQGAVRVRPRRNPDAARVVPAGYAARYTAAAIDEPQPVQESGIAWRDGFIVARGMRLDAFIQELGRYHRVSLSCDPGIAGLRVSGSFPLGDLEQVLRTVATTLGVRVEIHARRWGRKAARLLPAPAGAPA